MSNLRGVGTQRMKKNKFIERFCPCGASVGVKRAGSKYGVYRCFDCKRLRKQKYSRDRFARLHKLGKI